jgi:7-carboxy-7-deazaguanine synthase
MAYTVKEIFYSLQGEGAQVGRPAVFCRFTGCNLWSGYERDRPTAICRFCDTDFVGADGPRGGHFREARSLVDAILDTWPSTDEGHRPYVICTGGEPTLQLDDSLLHELKERGAQVAIETNGTRPLPEGLDWVCVSPKANAQLAVYAGDELKIVFPQVGLDPARFENLSFRYFFLQPMDGDNAPENLQQAARYCLGNPRWRLSLQTHKILGLR